MSNEVIILLAVGIVSLIVIAYLVKKYRDKKVSEYLNSLPTRAQTLNLNIRANSGTNLYTGNWRATGKTISVPQYSVSVTIQWTDKLGVQKERSETLLFPNFLQSVGAADLKEWLTELMIREARQRLEID
jgi:hypothetical protein